jgi:hypothetical protein
MFFENGTKSGHVAGKIVGEIVDRGAGACVYLAKCVDGE